MEGDRPADPATGMGNALSPVADGEVAPSPATLTTGLTIGARPLEPPRLLRRSWRNGQTFTARDDPDRMMPPNPPWTPPGFVEAVDPTQRAAETTVDEISLPGLAYPGDHRWARVVHGVFTADECEALVTEINGKGFTPALLNIGGGMQRFMPEFRNGHRVIVDSAGLAGWLLEVLRPHLDAELPDGAALADLNERCRVLCYTPGQFFAEHCDGRYVRPAGDRKGDCSRVTLQLYLHDVPVGNGGATTFLDPRGRDPPVPCQPRMGSVLLFTQNVLHEGSLVAKGIKYTMRTEAMYTPKRGEPRW